MAYRSISRLRMVIRWFGFLGLLALDLCPVALILVATALCTAMSAQDLPSNTDRPTPEEPQTPGTPVSSTASTGAGSEDTVAAAAKDDNYDACRSSAYAKLRSQNAVIRPLLSGARLDDSLERPAQRRKTLWVARR
jgi:hypothetical protein